MWYLLEARNSYWVLMENFFIIFMCLEMIFLTPLPALTVSLTGDKQWQPVDSTAVKPGSEG